MLFFLYSQKVFCGVHGRDGNIFMSACQVKYCSGILCNIVDFVFFLQFSYSYMYFPLVSRGMYGIFRSFS